MNRKYKNILYTFDLIGITPQLKIFNKSTYKTILSSIISIAIIFLSISFSLYSIILYFKFDNPIIIYSKANDKSTNRTFLIKDTLLVLLLVEPISNKFKYANKSEVWFESIYSEIDPYGNYIEKPLILDSCKLGINLDIKYKEFIDDIKDTGFLLNESYCISQECGDFPIYYHPETGSSELHFNITFKNKNTINPQKVQAMIVSENDIMIHNNKANPIINGFDRHITPNLNLNEFTTINYDMQYIKYESDNGLIFRSPTTFNDNYTSNNKISLGEIIIRINKTNFDNYSRSYDKLQILITEIYTIIILFFNIGKIIIKILLEKKMSKDIIRILLNEETIVNEINHSQVPNQQYKINKLFKNIEKNKISSLELMKSNAKSEEKINAFENLEKHNKSNINNKTIKRNSLNESDKILKKLNFINIIKSYFCFKDRKTLLINACHKFVINNISIEKILETIYKLENVYYILLKKNKHKFKTKKYVNKRLREINKYIYEINKKSEIEKY